LTNVELFMKKTEKTEKTSFSRNLSKH
jgi:hypothetical protein